MLVYIHYHPTGAVGGFLLILELVQIPVQQKGSVMLHCYCARLQHLGIA